MKKITIFDTTLRDWQQSPWAWMSFEQNIKFAEMLSMAMRWNWVIEAWFPAASNTDYSIVNEISKQFWVTQSSPIIAWLSQLKQDQIEKTIRALEPGIDFGRSRLHTYFPVDPNLMKASVWIDSTDTKKLDKIVESVFRLSRLAANAGMQVQFSPEWYSRLKNWVDNFDFVTNLLIAAVEWWVRIINFPDTIWWACRLEWKDYFVSNAQKHIDIIKKQYPNISMIYSVHCHNDFNLATENSINAVTDSDISQIECTVNGVWERAWNTSLEQIVMILNHFGHKNWFYSDFDISMLQKLSDFISINMLSRQAHFPIVWDNAAKHTAGWHVNAILENPTVYQPFDPQLIWKTIELVFWPLSGSNLAQDIIVKNGYKCTDQEKVQITQFIKDYYSDRRKWVSDKELLKAYFEYRKPIKATKISYSKSSWSSTINIEWEFFWQKFLKHTHYGKNSALAALKEAINKYFNWFDIVESKSSSQWDWIWAYSIHTIRLQTKIWVIYEWVWKDEDIETAAIKALIQSANQLYIETNYKI